MTKAKNKKTSSKKQKNSPVLQFSVLCDGVAQGNNNKPVFIGIFSNLNRTGLIPQFFVINRWIYGEGEFTQKVVIRSPNLKDEVAQVEGQVFKLENEINSADLGAAFVNVNFKEAGVHWVQVYLDDQMVLSYPLPVYDHK